MLASIDFALLDRVTGGADDNGIDLADAVVAGLKARYCGSLANAAQAMAPGPAADIVKTQAKDCWKGLEKSFEDR
jgi:hypothetical protein